MRGSPGRRSDRACALAGRENDRRTNAALRLQWRRSSGLRAQDAGPRGSASAPGRLTSEERREAAGSTSLGKESARRRRRTNRRAPARSRVGIVGLEDNVPLLVDVDTSHASTVRCRSRTSPAKSSAGNFPCVGRRCTHLIVRGHPLATSHSRVDKTDSRCCFPDLAPRGRASDGEQRTRGGEQREPVAAARRRVNAPTYRRPAMSAVGAQPRHECGFRGQETHRPNRLSHGSRQGSRPIVEPRQTTVVS